MSDNKMFFGGIPTDIEIKKLRRAYPKSSMKVGQTFTYKEVEKLIGAKPRTNRWNAITVRWRKLVEYEHGIIIGTERGLNRFKVLSEGEKVTLSKSKLRSAGRMARRSYIVASRVDTAQLTEQEKLDLDHSIKRSVAIMQVGKLRQNAELPEMFTTDE